MPKARRSILPVALATSAALMLLPGAGQAAGRTQTLRVFDKAISMKLTHADGTVITRAPFPEPQPGDVLEVNSLDYRGNHAHHSCPWQRFFWASNMHALANGAFPWPGVFGQRIIHNDD